jgi:hypothetical protein
VATQTALERDEAAYFSGVGDDLQARERYMAAKGVHVTSPDSDEDGITYCPTPFPVVGTPYGVYYSPNDDTCPKINPDTTWIGVCFTSEDAAAAAGYVHGPVNLTVATAE